MDISKINIGDLSDSASKIQEQLGQKADILKRIKSWGEYGNSTNDKFDSLEKYFPASVKINSISFHSGDILDGISIKYSDGSAAKLGGQGGFPHEIPLASEKIKKITGRCKSSYCGHRLITNVSVETMSGKIYGPFGAKSDGELFEILAEGNEFAGFFGSTSGPFIASLGAYFLKP